MRWSWFLIKFTRQPSDLCKAISAISFKLNLRFGAQEVSAKFNRRISSFALALTLELTRRSSALKPSTTIMRCWSTRSIDERLIIDFSKLSRRPECCHGVNCCWCQKLFRIGHDAFKRKSLIQNNLLLEWACDVERLVLPLHCRAVTKMIARMIWLNPKQWRMRS